MKHTTENLKTNDFDGLVTVSYGHPIKKFLNMCCS